MMDKIEHHPVLGSFLQYIDSSNQSISPPPPFLHPLHSSTFLPHLACRPIIARSPNPERTNPLRPHPPHLRHLLLRHLHTVLILASLPPRALPLLEECAYPFGGRSGGQAAREGVGEFTVRTGGAVPAEEEGARTGPSGSTVLGGLVEGGEGVCVGGGVIKSAVSVGAATVEST